MTTSGRASEAAASAFLAALAGAAAVGAWRLGLGDVHQPGPGFMPFGTACLLGVMALGQLARTLARRDDTGASPFARSRWGIVAVVLATLAGFGLALERVGFTLTTIGLLLVLFGPVARKRWWVALTAAVAIAVVARIALRAVGMQLPAGPLGL